MRVSMDYNPLLYSRTNVNLSANQKADGFFSLPEKSAPEPNEHVAIDIWEELSKSYNIRNASIREIQEISAKLYKAGQISLFNHGMLAFEPMLAPPGALKVNIHMTPFNADGRKDWIAEYEQRAQSDLKTGNPMGYVQNQKVVEILRHLFKDSDE